VNIAGSLAGVWLFKQPELGLHATSSLDAGCWQGCWRLSFLSGLGARMGLAVGLVMVGGWGGVVG